VGSDDYVLGYLAEMVAGREARLVEERGRIVAMAGITECADGALWLGQLRTHPRFRRSGYATRLLDDAFRQVVRDHRPALRLWTSRRNAASQALFARNGFRRVATFTRVMAPALSGSASLTSRLRDAAPARVAAVWERWRRSGAGRSGHGYVEYQWHFVPLSPAVFRKMSRRGDVFASGRSAAVLWSEDGDPAAYGAVLAGGRPTLYWMRRLAAGLRRERVEVFLPDSPGLIQAARAAGFGPAGWGREAILFERSNPRRRAVRARTSSRPAGR
jgi:hypothetical protein